MGFLLSGGGCGYTQATLTTVWVALPCGRNLSSVDIAKCDPKFRLEKKFENRQKHQKRSSACVGQADFGKFELNNIRNDSGNSQRLSVLSVKRDQFETRSIRNKRGRMFRPSRFRRRTRKLLSLAILRLLRIRCLHLVWLASCKT